jgi:hypothetical protein
MECMFSLENGRHIEAVRNASELFSEIPLTYGIMTVPYALSEGRLLLPSFFLESANSCDYSLSIR